MLDDAQPRVTYICILIFIRASAYNIIWQQMWHIHQNDPPGPSTESLDAGLHFLQHNVLQLSLSRCSHQVSSSCHKKTPIFINSPRQVCRTWTCSSRETEPYPLPPSLLDHLLALPIQKIKKNMEKDKKGLLLFSPIGRLRRNGVVRIIWYLFFVRREL